MPDSAVEGLFETGILYFSRANTVQKTDDWQYRYQNRENPVLFFILPVGVSRPSFSAVPASEFFNNISNL